MGIAADLPLSPQRQINISIKNVRIKSELERLKESSVLVNSELKIISVMYSKRKRLQLSANCDRVRGNITPYHQVAVVCYSPSKRETGRLSIDVNIHSHI